MNVEDANSHSQPSVAAHIRQPPLASSLLSQLPNKPTYSHQDEMSVEFWTNQSSDSSSMQSDCQMLSWYPQYSKEHQQPLDYFLLGRQPYITSNNLDGGDSATMSSHGTSRQVSEFSPTSSLSGDDLPWLLSDVTGDQSVLADPVHLTCPRRTAFVQPVRRNSPTAQRSTFANDDGHLMLSENQSLRTLNRHSLCRHDPLVEPRQWCNCWACYKASADAFEQLNNSLDLMPVGAGRPSRDSRVSHGCNKPFEDTTSASSCDTLVDRISAVQPLAYYYSPPSQLSNDPTGHIAGVEDKIPNANATKESGMGKGLGCQEVEVSLPSQPMEMDFQNPSGDCDEHVISTLRTAKTKDEFLVRAKSLGISYRDIRSMGCFKEAESTLRGRYRTLTKAKQDRVRQPQWTRKDVRLLTEAVAILGKGNHGRKTPWKRVAEYIVQKGGSYHYGNATCRKKWDQLANRPRTQGSSPVTV